MILSGSSVQIDNDRTLVARSNWVIWVTRELRTADDVLILRANFRASRNVDDGG